MFALITSIASSPWLPSRTSSAAVKNGAPDARQMSDRAPAPRKPQGARAPSAAVGKGAGTASKQPQQPMFNVGVWSADEHQRYLRAKLQNPKAAWKDIARCVGTRTPRQVVLHDQKYRAKMARLWSKCQTVAEQTKEPPKDDTEETEAKDDRPKEEMLEAWREEEKEEMQEKIEQPMPQPEAPEFVHSPDASSPPRSRPPPFTLPVAQARPLQPAASHPPLFTLPPLPSAASLPRPLMLPPLSHTRRSLAPAPAFPHAFSSIHTVPSSTNVRIQDADSMGVLLLATVASAQLPTGTTDDGYYYGRNSSHR